MGFEILENLKINKKLFISIITPTFNRSSELKYLFKSLINQSFPPTNFELIIVLKRC